MKRRNSALFAPLTLFAMAGVCSYGAYASTSMVTRAHDAQPEAVIIAPSHDVSTPQFLAWAQSDTHPASFALSTSTPALILADAAVAAQVTPVSEPSFPPASPGSLTPTSPAPADASLKNGRTTLVLAEIDCRRDGHEGHTALTLEQLTALMSHVIDTAGPSAPVELVHALLQAALDRSLDDPTLKMRAIGTLLDTQPADTKVHLALAESFNLAGSGAGFPNGYDPCGNPTATPAGLAFGSGPFSGNFTTINPIPVIASKSGKTGETIPAI